MSEETRDTRREALKKVGKVAAFVIPTIVTFDIPALATPASGSDPFSTDGSYVENGLSSNTPFDPLAQVHIVPEKEPSNPHLDKGGLKFVSH